MAEKVNKTNVTRLLDSRKIPYSFYAVSDEAVNAVTLAELLGADCKRVFKTLVTVGRSGEHYVFMLPADGELDLKKAAKLTGEKSVEMIPQKELLPLTGYIHGGCSPIGMKVKKQFDTYIHQTAADCDTIYFSAGHIGWQVQMSLCDLQKVVKVQPADINKD